MCDVGSNYNLVKSYMDLNAANIIYSGTTKGEILIFDSHSVVHRGDTAECKLIGKILTNLYYDMQKLNQTI